MNNLLKLIDYCGKVAKLIYEAPVDFSRSLRISNNAIKEVSKTCSEREIKFARAMINAILDYIEDEWREKRDAGN